MSRICVKSFKFVIFLVLAAIPICLYRISDVPIWVSYLFLTVGMVLAIPSMLMLYCNKDKYKGDDSGHHGQEREGSEDISDFLEKYTPTICIYVFGGGSLCLRLFHVTASAQCLPYYWSYTLASNVTSSNISEFSSTTTDASASTETPFPNVGGPSHSAFMKELGRLACHFVDIIFMLALLSFLQMVSKFRGLKENFGWHRCILIVIGAVAAMWLYTFVMETNLMPASHPTSSGFVDYELLSKACLENASPLQGYMHGTLEHTLFPLTLQFMLTAMEILTKAWYFLEPVQASREESARRVLEMSAPEPTVSGQSDRPCMGQPRTRDHVTQALPAENEQVRGNGSAQTTGVPWTKTRAWGKFIGIFQLNAAFVFILIKGVMLRCDLVYGESINVRKEHIRPENFDLHNIRLFTALTRLLLARIPGVLIAAHCVYVMANFEKREDAPGMKTELFAIAVAATGALGLVISEIVFGIFKSGLASKDSIFGFYVIELLLYIPEIVLTVIVIHKGKTKVYDPTKPLAYTLQGALSFLTMYSLGCWAIDSFLEMDYCIERNSSLHERDLHAWKVCVHIFLPLCTFFRFVSALRLLTVKNCLRPMKHTATTDAQNRAQRIEPAALPGLPSNPPGEPSYQEDHPPDDVRSASAVTATATLRPIAEDDTPGTSADSVPADRPSNENSPLMSNA